MHLGRFHAVIYKLNKHLHTSDIIPSLDGAINSMPLYSSSKTPEHLDAFKEFYAKLTNQTSINEALLQPYAKKTIDELGLTPFTGSELAKSVETAIKQNSFDQKGIVESLTALRDDLSAKAEEIRRIDEAFTELGVEYEAVFNGESEVGILIPREITGEKIEDLTKELQQINRTFRAINELTGNEEYSPSIRTISTSWWQVFLEADHTQIAAWIFAIERIVALFKTNLEIKALQKELEGKDISKKITTLIEKEIQEKINTGIGKIAKDLRKKYASNKDENRLNELEIQLKQGLSYLAKRISEGAEIEINTSLPQKPKKPAQDAPEEILLAYETSIKEYEEIYKELKSLQTQGYLASQSILQIEKDSPLSISYDEEIKSQHESSNP